MKQIAFVGLALTWLAGGVVEAQEAKKAKPGQEHQWLHQLVGEWDYVSEAVVEPGKPPMKAKGTETVRAVGAYWIMAEIRGTADGSPFTGVMTVGYDADEKQYVGTWIDSMNSHMLFLEGALDRTGKTLTLYNESPNPAKPGELSKYRDVIELKSKDHKVLTSAVQGEDGKWIPFLTVDYRRKK